LKKLIETANHKIGDQEFDFVYNIVVNHEGEDGKVSFKGFLDVLKTMKKDYNRYVGVGIS
jgi:hypothetical protein